VVLHGEHGEDHLEGAQHLDAHSLGCVHLDRNLSEEVGRKEGGEVGQRKRKVSRWKVF